MAISQTLVRRSPLLCGTEPMGLLFSEHLQGKFLLSAWGDLDLRGSTLFKLPHAHF